ncbi:MAG: hypothetical protein JEY97_11605 [Bacteroidales bacterium]|nr:hypothetical protein [Bacteroidales bacterium]
MKKIYTIALIILSLIITKSTFSQKENLKSPTDNEQQIELSEGYSFISSRIIAENPNMQDILQNNLVNLEFVRNSQGFMLQKIGPVWVNNIGDWVNTEGYLFKMSAADNLIMVGEAISQQTPISLSVGYQIIGYLPDQPINTEEVFQNLLENLGFVRNTAGFMFQKIGPNWVNSIGDMQPGEGYLVKMLADDILIYPTIINQPPNPPYNPSPGNGTINQPLGEPLSWWCYDPEGDPLTYDVYFGTETTPPVVSTGQTNPNYYPGSLVYGTTYFWKIVAHDNQGNTTEGDVWSFTTIQNQPPYQPIYPIPENGAENQSIETNLSWECYDPNNDLLNYDIYFGTEATPPLVVTGQTATTYNPGTMENFTQYFWKIVAHDYYENTTEGPVWSFTTEEGASFQCGEPFTDPRDGQTYLSVQIGDQCWMGENLNIGEYVESIMIPGNSHSDVSNNGIIEKYCYDNNTSNCDTYGGLYDWNEMMQYTTTPGVQGICPAGWHIPTDDEWKILEGTVDSQYPVGDPIWNNMGWRGFDAGKNLKSSYGWNYGGNGSGLYAFNGLPAGFRAQTGWFGEKYNLTLFWSSNVYDDDDVYAWVRKLLCSHNDSQRDGGDKIAGLSVRCLLGGSTPVNNPPNPPSSPYPESGAENQSIETILIWSCTDPEGDPMTYDIYFGTDSTPLVASGYADTTYNPGTLEINTVYYWKIVAHDDHSNTTEGPFWSFATGDCVDPITDPRDGNVYDIVLIGEQCWMAENLNIGIQINGSENMTGNGVIEKYCYDNLIANCIYYGGLYQWNEMMEYGEEPGIQGICPEGWHLPTDDEWKILEGTVDSQYPIGDTIWDNWGLRGFDAGKNLKSTSYWSENTGTDAFGFKGHPGGCRGGSGVFGFVNDWAMIWSSSRDDYLQDFSWERTLDGDSDQVLRTTTHRDFGLSVRCLRDQD